MNDTIHSQQAVQVLNVWYNLLAALDLSTLSVSWSLLIYLWPASLVLYYFLSAAQSCCITLSQFPQSATSSVSTTSLPVTCLLSFVPSILRILSPFAPCTWYDWADGGPKWTFVHQFLVFTFSFPLACWRWGLTLCQCFSNVSPSHRILYLHVLWSVNNGSTFKLCILETFFCQMLTCCSVHLLLAPYHVVM